MDLLIDDLTMAANEAIERAAGEAAKAAALASAERETAAMWEAARHQADAAKWRLEAEAAKKAGMKNTIIAALIGTLGGLALGVVIIR